MSTQELGRPERPELPERPGLPEETREGKLKLREALGHRWWGFVLVINFFFAPMGALALTRLGVATSPALSFVFWLLVLGGVVSALVWFLVSVWRRSRPSRPYQIASLALVAVVFLLASISAFLVRRSMTLPELSPLFWYLVLATLCALVVFAIFVLVYARTAYRLKVGDEIYDEVPAPRWAQSDLRERAGALWRGIVRLEFFGWVIWVTAAVAAIAGALRNPPADAPPLAGMSVLHQYFRTLDASAYDLIRATVVGTIVLFFVQLLKTYQEAIVAAGKAAKDAEKASQQAQQAVAEAGKIVPALDRQMTKTLDLLKGTGNILKSDMIASSLAHTLRLASDSLPTLGQVSEFSDKLFDHIGRINREVTHAYRSAAVGETIDPFDLVSLSAIYSTYLKVESLSFEGAVDDEAGRGGIRLSTRYPHYALAVRAVVESILRLDSERYRFYTVFSREPERFFNTTPGGSQDSVSLAQIRVNWTILFLERFCRWQHHNGIFYKRYFVSYARSDGDAQNVRIPPRDVDVREQLGNYLILCNVRDGKARPCLWGDYAWNFFEGAGNSAEQSVWGYLSEEEKRELREAIGEVIPSAEVRAALKETPAFQRVENPSYVIVGPERSSYFKAAVKPHAGEVELRPLKEVLLEYHSRISPPARLIFEDYNAYMDFFGANLPRDLLAVWDTASKCWCLCIGTTVGEHDPSAVVMVVTTKERPLRNLPWADLDKKLSELFIPEPAAAGGRRARIGREGIA